MRKRFATLAATAAMLAAAVLAVPAQASTTGAALEPVYKGMPTAAGATSNRATKAGPTFFYNTADQTPPAGTTGVYANTTIATPPVFGSGTHSLAEIGVNKVVGGLNNWVEFGWTVDFGLNGDYAPHLFSYWRKNGVGQCYNGCGYVAAAGAPVLMGGSIAADSGTNKQLGIKHDPAGGGGWWLSYNGSWIGMYPDSLWNTTTAGGAGASPAVTTFVDTTYYQVWGEIAVAGTPAASTVCTDMGNSTLGGTVTPLSARFAGTQLITPGGTINATLSGGAGPYPAYWKGNLYSARTWEFGGPGAC